MRIVQINTSDIAGGAEKMVLDLHRSYINLGFNSAVIVKDRKSEVDYVYKFPVPRWSQVWQAIENDLYKCKWYENSVINKLITVIKNPFFEYNRREGRENYHHPESRETIFKLIPNTDIFHLHNLHVNYFDLTMLPRLAKKRPTLITLHDEYLFTGHCAYTLGCERWQTGCGDCPHLKIYPSIFKDNSRFNWNKKRSILNESPLMLVTPSNWLAQRVGNSFLTDLPIKVIPNGVDLAVFKPDSKISAREALLLDMDSFIILYSAAGGRRSQFKDYEMLDEVIAILQKHEFEKSIILLALGGEQHHVERYNNVSMVEIPFINDSNEMAKYYQSCDLYIHTAKAENAPLVIMEAMACGKPVIATRVGGIPEMVRENESGYTVQTGDAYSMASLIISLIDDSNRLNLLGEKAYRIAKNEYSILRVVDNYLDLYQHLIDERKK